MGIFNKTDRQTTKAAGPTIISEGTHFIGGISTTGTVHIDGQYEGVILEAESITVGKTGRFIGDIKSNKIYISGHVDGKIDCNEIHMFDGAQVIGEIKYIDFSIDTSANFEGTSIKKDSTSISQYNQVENKINSIINNKVELSKKIETSQ